MPSLPQLRVLVDGAAVVNVSNTGDPLMRGTVDQLQKRLAAARQIVDALEGDDVLEHAALQLAWAQVLEHLLQGEDLKDCVAHIQKLASSGRARRRRMKGNDAPVLPLLSAATVEKIEETLGLM